MSDLVLLQAVPPRFAVGAVGENALQRGEVGAGPQRRHQVYLIIAQKTEA